MPNPFSGIISDGLKQLFNDAIDSLLYDDALTRPCLLIFGGRFEDCNNCVFDPIGNKSSNRFQAGGPVPFPNGFTCPMCGGSGKRQVEVTEDVNLMVIWDSRNWIELGVAGSRPSRSVHTPLQFAQTLSKLSTWASLNRANEAILDTDARPYKTLKYVRMGDPELCGIGSSRYVITMWERSG
jgi:hypothetical protein